MNRLRNRVTFSLASIVAATLSVVSLTGCMAGSFPDSSSPIASTGAAVSPPIQGSVYGGHAPLIGAKVYVLSPNTGTLKGQSISLMDGDTQNSGLTPSGSGNGLVSSGGTNGYHYVTTDLTGAFSLTGDYACTAGQPVYIVGVGGSPTYPSGSNTFPVKSFTVDSSTNIGGTGKGKNPPPQYEYTGYFTLDTTTGQGYSNPIENFFIGEQVAISGITNDTFLNGTATVVATDLTTTTFNLNGTYDDASGAALLANGTVLTFTGTYGNNEGKAVASPTVNPAAVNMATLGICPSSGSFAGSVHYVYMNEVSTAATAIATAAFGSGPFNIGVVTGGPNDTYFQGVNGGTSSVSYVLNGVAQAFTNAGLLYDIQGSDVSTVYAGEGHIARALTPAGNGIVPQALLDTWGNILAACVDSNNIAGTPSAQCTTLFNTATSNGIAIGSTGAGTAPTDIATAAFNIAHYPAGTAVTVGTNPTFVKTLYTLPNGNPPFAPSLVTTSAGQPNDFTVAIAFAAPAGSSTSTTMLIKQPQVISINGGQYLGVEPSYVSESATPQESVWIGNFGSQAVKLFATTGAPDYTANASAGMSGTANVRSVIVDGANNVWMSEQNALVAKELSVTGTLLQTFTPPTGTYTNALDGAIDGIGTSYHLYLEGYSTNDMLKASVVNGTTPSVTNLTSAGIAGTTAFSTAACLGDSATLAFSPTGTLYSDNDTAASLCTINTSTGAQVNNVAGFTYENVGEGPAKVAIDSHNVAWVGGGSSLATGADSLGLISYTNGGTHTAHTGGGLADPCGVAVDGADNIWVGNAYIYGVSEFSNAGVALSPVADTAANANALGGFNPQINNTYTLNGVTVFNPATVASNCGSPAIDRAGDVWMAYQGSGSYVPEVVFEIIGVAAPVVTPTAYATFGNSTTGYLGVRPH